MIRQVRSICRLFVQENTIIPEDVDSLRGLEELIYRIRHKHTKPSPRAVIHCEAVNAVMDQQDIEDVSPSPNPEEVLAAIYVDICLDSKIKALSKAADDHKAAMMAGDTDNEQSDCIQ